MEQIKVKIPLAFQPLLKEKKRYKFFHGGRAGGKSYAFADSALLRGRMNKEFIVCLREIQDSIKDSVYKLLCDRISYYDFKDYQIFEDRIENTITGTKIIFKGLRDQDSMKIKSLEGATIAWLEEAQAITKKSFDILDPTIRRDGSEIWISMNREEENDPLWVLLAVKTDERTIVVKVNYTDNPFCPEEIKIQAEKCRRENPADYIHIWLGEPKAQGDNKLISAAQVAKALDAQVDPETARSPKIIGVDVARFGNDKTAIIRRQGRAAYRLELLAGLDVVAVANRVTHVILEERPVRVFIDVGGLGAGVYDILVDRGYAYLVRAVNFGEKAGEPERFANRRSEMWSRLNDWLNSNLPVSLTDVDGLIDDLLAPNKGYDKLGRLLLEKKEEIKKRLGKSTDGGDALALTFAEPIYEMGLTDEGMRIDAVVDDAVYI